MSTTEMNDQLAFASGGADVPVEQLLALYRLNRPALGQDGELSLRWRSPRIRSQDRLNKTRVHFGEILSAGRRAGAEFEPFMGALKDQVVYMGYDLNASAVSSLSEDAKNLNAQADKLFARIDEG